MKNISMFCPLLKECSVKSRMYQLKQQVVMRTVALLVLLVAVASAHDISKFASMVQTGTRDNDAVQSVYTLLEDLKTENQDLQGVSDAKDANDEEIGLNVVAQLTNIANINQNNYVDAKAFREDIDNQIQNTKDDIDFGQNRLSEISRRSEELSDQRCYANSLFVKALKDHGDALEVVKLLKGDLSGYMTNSPSEFAQLPVPNVAAKLSMYSHLFKQEAIKSFMSLSGTVESEQDRQKGDTIPEKVYNVLLDLEEQLNANLADLQTQEIAAAFALARWLSNSDAEKEHLNSEVAKSDAKLEKLSVAQPAALSSETRVGQIHKDSVDAVNTAIEDLQEKKNYYQQQTARRAEENSIVDTILAIFKDQVSGLVSGSSYGRN